MATKLAPPLLTLLLLLFQLGFGVKSREAVDAGLDSSRDSKLHLGEVYALNAVISGLGLDVDPSGVCKTCDPGFVIKCNCSFKNNTECHIKYMKIKSGIDLSNGTIHDDISNFTFLETLSLEGCSLSGSIPYSLGKLSALKELNLRRNFLMGSIPPSLGKLRSLKNLSLCYNLLSGQIPQELGNLSNLEIMELQENNLRGHLPSELGSLSKLQHLDLGSNRLAGELPKSYAKLTSLRTFVLAGNNFTGQIPKFITTWRNLTELNLIGNEFEGGLPLEIFNSSTLIKLWVSDIRNSNVSFPEKATPNLSELVLRNCSITGQIPEYIAYSTALKYLDLSFNKLTGGIPYVSTYTEKMFLTRNMLNGSIFSIGVSRADVHNYELDFSYNNFTYPSSDNSIKEELYAVQPNIEPNRNTMHDLREKYCKGKSLYSSLFINCGGMETVVEKIQYDGDNATSNFYIDRNAKWAYLCSGDFLSESANSSDYKRNTTFGIFDTEAPLYKNARYCPLSLSYYGFCLMRGNYTVKLHFVENIYANDDDHSSSGERIFDVYIQGERRLKDFNIKEKANGPNKPYAAVMPTFIDDNLLEIHLFWAGKGSLHNTPGLNGPLISAISIIPNFTVDGERFSPPQIAGISLITLDVVLAPLLVLAFMWKMGWLGSKELQEIHIDIQDKSFTLKQIIDGTRNFSPKMEIGRGRYGIVYKAELPDGIKLAVKKISPDINKQVKDELKSEIFSLKSLRHENLVQLFDGYCNRKGLYVLIYEYMQNGSLHQVLFDPNFRTILDWKVRYDICLGIAKGLRYLHEEKRFDIVHGNIKATNIMLDQSYTAKLSDLGIARLCGEEDLFLSIVKARAARVYMAPEYARGEVITVKADVYSFGVVLLEIVSGKISADHTQNREVDFLLDKAWVLHKKNRILNLVDNKLSNYDRKQAFIVLNLAIMCVNQSATLRPTMSEVVGVLSNEITIDQISKANTS